MVVPDFTGEKLRVLGLSCEAFKSLFVKFNIQDRISLVIESKGGFYEFVRVW